MYNYQFKTILDLVQHHAIFQGNNIAYTFLIDGEQKENSITYLELAQRVSVLGAGIQARVAVGERVLLLYPPSLEYIISFLACLSAGVIPVPAYPPDNFNLTRLQGIASDAGTKVALSTKSIILRMHILEQIEDIEYALRSGSQISPDGYPGNIYRLNWLATDDVEGEETLDAFQSLPVEPDTIAFLQYTSGSTNFPKGVMLTHRNLLFNCKLMARTMQCTPDTYGVSWLPPYHDMGLIGGILLPLYAGFPVTLMTPTAFLKKPIRWLQAISNSKNKCKVISGAPDFAYQLCINKITPEQVAQVDLQHWEIAFSGAEPVRAETLTRFATKFASAGFRSKAWLPVYGLAEGTLLTSAGELHALPVIKRFDTRQLEENQAVELKGEDHSEPTLLVGCGQALAGQQIEIVNPDTLHPCVYPEIGEIWLAGASIATGYWNNHGETGRAFYACLTDSTAGPFFRTGDLGFIWNGELFVTGRLKDLIIIRGRNHYPQDIELTVTASHHALRKGSGVAFSISLDGEVRLVVVQEIDRAFVRSSNEVEIKEAIVQAIFQQHGLQVYTIVLVKPASLPKTSSGKLQRQLCRKLFRDGDLKASKWQQTATASVIPII